MTDSEIIWKYLSHEIPNDHLAVYLTASNNTRSHKIAITMVMQIIKIIFYPCISEEIIESAVKTYLENKKKLYILGVIDVKAVY